MSRSFARGGYGGQVAYVRELADLRDDDFGPAHDAHDAAWLLGMCELVGVPAPTFEACVRLTREVTEFVAPRVHAPFPEVVASVLALHADGVTLYTASGERSLELDGYLRGLAIRDCFEGDLFGIDLVKMPKVNPTFYTRIFLRLGIEPVRAIVVDDSPMAVAWARAAGAHAVLLDRSRSGAPAADGVIGSLEQLAPLLQAYVSR
jgi:HAD superfamily hydrolase (TIGR01509 family)